MGIWGGLWSLPECPTTGDPLEWCRDHLGCEAEVVEKFPARRHTFSHFLLEIQPLRLRLVKWPDRVAENDGLLWHTPGRPLAIGLPAPVERLLRDIGKKVAGAFLMASGEVCGRQLRQQDSIIQPINH
jgi:A/G-specific adenine glycosylase